MQIINPTYAPIILTDLIYVIHFSFYHSNPLSSILLEVTAPFNSILLTVAITRCLIAKFKTQIPPPKPSLNSLLQQTFSEIKFAHFNLYLTILLNSERKADFCSFVFNKVSHNSHRAEVSLFFLYFLPH